MGGEKTGDSGQPEYVQGSPPRGRGKATTAGRWVQETRITPAWAGKRVRAHVPANRNEDHPRVGGEKTKKIP